jgi:hypothetical protein
MISSCRDAIKVAFESSDNNLSDIFNNIQTDTIDIALPSYSNPDVVKDIYINDELFRLLLNGRDPIEIGSAGFCTCGTHSLNSSCMGEMLQSPSVSQTITLCKRCEISDEDEQMFRRRLFNGCSDSILIDALRTYKRKYYSR